MNKGAILIFVIVILIAGGAFFYYSKGNLTNVIKGNITQNSQPVTGDPWEAIKKAITECHVTQVSQVHSLKVTVWLKDGSLINATEPRIDDIITAAEAAADSCGDIPMMTE
jgi:hypothetical protein